MIVQSQVEAWIELASQDNLEANSIIEVGNSDITQKSFLKRFLVEIKTQIDRWDLLTAYFVSHPALKSFIYETLGGDLVVTKESVELWGVEFLFHVDVPLDVVVGLNSLTPAESKEIAIGKIDLTLINRLNNLKAFW